MLNSSLGNIRIENGRKYIETVTGRSGHAVYGPYALVDPGFHVVEFKIDSHQLEGVRNNEVLAVIDVCTDFGTRILAKKSITAKDISRGNGRFPIKFHLAERCQLEYRVGVSGHASLVIDNVRRVHFNVNPDDIETLLDEDQFPNTEGAPPFFLENERFFREQYELGLGVKIENNGVVLSKDGVRFNARCPDDTNFIGEIFFERAYNISMDRDVCVIDIGMNIGLASLQFASRPYVKEVHAFEPFGSTYERAQANLALNPVLASKISAHNIGLGDRDALETFKIRDTQDSGARSTRNDDAGEIEVQLQMRAAGAVLEPIIAKAEALGRVVLAKIDCEGAEYAVFESLEAAGLLERISVFVMEWHPVIPGKSLSDLLEPLRARGFVIIDRSPLIGQGVFYAVRLPV